MAYDSYSGEPEPKLLAIDCFPTFFTPPPPPHYQVIMAANTRYHRLPEDNRAPFESPTRDAELLLGPLSSGKNPTAPKKEHKFSYHPTLFLRLVVLFASASSSNSSTELQIPEGLPEAVQAG
jgi:hypothetical protein